MIDKHGPPLVRAQIKTCPVCSLAYTGSTCSHCGRTGAGTAIVRNTRQKIANSAVPSRRSVPPAALRGPARSTEA